VSIQVTEKSIRLITAMYSLLHWINWPTMLLKCTLLRVQTAN